MSLEESARRMTALLARKPRSKKTRDYVSTLPKRKTVVVSPADYQLPPSPPPKPEAMTPRATVKAVAYEIRHSPKRLKELRAFDAAVSARLDAQVRKDRLRPRRRQQGPPDEPNLLERIAFIQGGRCVHCAGPLKFRAHESTDDAFPTFEHVIPRAMGGVNVGNRLAAHRVCNMRKGNSKPTGCEMVMLLAVNARLGVEPTRF